MFASFLCLQHLVVACVFGVFNSASSMYMQCLAIAARLPLSATVEMYPQNSPKSFMCASTVLRTDALLTLVHTKQASLKV